MPELPQDIDPMAPFRLDGGAFQMPPAEIVRAEVFGETVFFTITSRRDVIQREHHAKGEFYEPEELEIIRRAFRPGDLFVDIGANIGNHALFVAKFLHPRQVIVVEPNPVAFNVLLSNLILNRVEHKFDISWIGHGVGEETSATFGMTFNERNVGGGRLVEGEGGIPLATVDRIVGDRRADFIKIDVEGMELQVLRSMTETITRDKPRIFIEVDRGNQADFDQWVRDNNYASVARFRRYRRNENFLLVHREDNEWE